MYKYVFVKEGKVVATLETSSPIDDSSAFEYESLKTEIPFKDLLGCHQSTEGFARPTSSLDPTVHEIEVRWRNAELDYIDSKNYASDFPYLTEVLQYKQALRDYTEVDGFPATERPQRPLTPKGQPIIT